MDSSQNSEEQKMEKQQIEDFPECTERGEKKLEESEHTMGQIIFRLKQRQDEISQNIIQMEKRHETWHEEITQDLSQLVENLENIHRRLHKLETRHEEEKHRDQEMEAKLGEETAKRKRGFEYFENSCRYLETAQVKTATELSENLNELKAGLKEERVRKKEIEAETLRLQAAKDAEERAFKQEVLRRLAVMEAQKSDAKISSPSSIRVFEERESPSSPRISEGKQPNRETATPGKLDEFFQRQRHEESYLRKIETAHGHLEDFEDAEDNDIPFNPGRQRQYPTQSRNSAALKSTTSVCGAGSSKNFMTPQRSNFEEDLDEYEFVDFHRRTPPNSHNLYSRDPGQHSTGSKNVRVKIPNPGFNNSYNVPNVNSTAQTNQSQVFQSMLLSTLLEPSYMSNLDQHQLRHRMLPAKWLYKVVNHLTVPAVFEFMKNAFEFTQTYKQPVNMVVAVSHIVRKVLEAAGMRATLGRSTHSNNPQDFPMHLATMIKHVQPRSPRDLLSTFQSCVHFPVVKTQGGLKGITALAWASLALLDDVKLFFDAFHAPDIQVLPTNKQSGSLFYILQKLPKIVVEAIVNTTLLSNTTLQVIKHLNSWLGIRHIVSLVDRHESNGVERINTELLRHISAIVHDERLLKDWDSPRVLPLVKMIINEQPQPKLGGYSPTQLKFGTQDIQYTMINPQSTPGEQYGQYVAELDHTLKTIRQVVADAHTRLAQERIMETPPDTTNSYAVGDLVLLKRRIKPNKLSPKYLGPYEVLQIYKNDITCRHLVTHETKILHIENLQMFFGIREAGYAAAQRDADQHVIRTIITHKGDPLKRTTMSFKVEFEDNDIVWKPYDKDLADSIHFETYCQTKPFLQPLLVTERQAKAANTALLSVPIHYRQDDLIYVDPFRMDQ